MSVITSLVGYWPMNEASGSALDAHGSNPLTDNNTITSAVGLVSGARDFEADNTQYFSHTDNSDLSLGSDTDFSWFIWWNAETVPNGSGAPLIVKGGGGSSGEYILWFPGAGGIQFSVGNGSSFASVDTVGSPELDTGVWHCAAVWHDSVSNEIGIQVDGGTVATTPWSGGTQDGAAPLRIGYDGTFWTFGKYDGRIDEVGFWKKTLTSTERAWLRNSGSGRDYAAIVAEAVVFTIMSRTVLDYVD